MSRSWASSPRPRKSKWYGSLRICGCELGLRRGKAVVEVRDGGALPQVELVLDLDDQGAGRDQPFGIVRAAYQSRLAASESLVSSVTMWNQGNWSAGC